MIRAAPGAPSPEHRRELADHAVAAQPARRPAGIIRHALDGRLVVSPTAIARENPRLPRLRPRAAIRPNPTHARGSTRRWSAGGRRPLSREQLDVAQRATGRTCSTRRRNRFRREPMRPMASGLLPDRRSIPPTSAATCEAGARIGLPWSSPLGHLRTKLAGVGAPLRSRAARRNRAMPGSRPGRRVAAWASTHSSQCLS